MSPSIPFLRLPNVPQLLILEYLSLFQLFEFSFLSKKAAQIAKTRKRNIKELHWYANYANPKFSLEMINYEGDYFRIYFQIGCGMNKTEEITFEGRKLKIRPESAKEMVLVGEKDQSNEERLELFEKLTEHFLVMFNVENYYLDVSNAADLTKCSIWRYTKTFKQLRPFFPAVLTAREMEFVLGELTVTDHLRIDSKVAEGWTEWTEPLNTEYIVLEDGHCLSLDVYLNSEVRDWYICDDTFPTTHLNAIMKKWLDGGLERLKSFVVEIPSNDKEDRLNEALEGIQTFPWDRMTRKKMWRNVLSIHRADKNAPPIERTIDTSKGRDMRRSDGKLATAGFYYDRFYFVVLDSDQLQQGGDTEDVAPVRQCGWVCK